MLTVLCLAIFSVFLFASANVNFPSKTSYKLYLQTNFQMHEPSTICYVVINIVRTEQHLHILHWHTFRRKNFIIQDKVLKFQKRFIRLCRKFDCT